MGAGGAQGPNGLRGTPLEILAQLRTVHGQTVEPTDEPATQTLAQLRDGQLAWRAAIQSFRVKLTYLRERKAKSGKEAASGAALADDFTFEADFAFKGEKRYSTYADITPSRLPKSGRLQGPSYLRAYNGSEFRRYEPGTLSAVVAAEPGNEFEGPASLFFDCVFLPIGAAYEGLRLTDWFVPNALQAEDRFRVEPKLERVDGRLCHVVSSDADVLWIDPDEGCVVRRRAMFRRTGPTDPGMLNALYVLQDFRQTDPAVWLPTKCLRVDYGTHDEPKSLQGKELAVNRITAEYEVNTVADELFELEIPPGTLVVDQRKQIAYHMPQGVEQLDAAIAEGMPVVENRVIGKEAVLETRSHWVLIVNGALLLGLVGLLLYARWRRAAARRKPDGDLSA